MEAAMHADPGGAQSAVEANARLLRAFEAGKMSSSVFFENILGGTFAADERTWDESINVIPASLQSQFLEYVRSSLVAVDFMPPLGAYYPVPQSPAEIQAIQEERRPRYIRLLQRIEQICMPEGN
jgi:hypothetical protein